MNANMFIRLKRLEESVDEMNQRNGAMVENIFIGGFELLYKTCEKCKKNTNYTFRHDGRSDPEPTHCEHCGEKFPEPEWIIDMIQHLKKFKSIKHKSLKRQGVVWFIGSD